MRIACWIPKATNTYSEYLLLCFHGNSGCTNAPQCFIILTLSVLLCDWFSTEYFIQLLLLLLSVV